PRLCDRRDKSHRHSCATPLPSMMKRGHEAWSRTTEEDLMSITAGKTVREVALENPAATRVFEKLGIDYCCGGNKSLEEACRTANVPMDEVLDSLEIAEQSARAVQWDRNWTTEMLADLVAHIISTHHKYTREEMARLGPLFDKVCSVHGK